VALCACIGGRSEQGERGDAEQARQRDREDFHSAATLCVAATPRAFTTTLIASSTRSLAYRIAVGKSSSGKVCVWILVASNRFWLMNASARWVALFPSPRMP